jgi:Na+/proline symporter
MQWDLGLLGIAVLAVMSAAFGAFVQAVFWNRASRWLWLPATALAFALGVLISESWFGWATEAELQPNIDGLSFDEVFVGFIVAGLAVVAARFVMSRRSHRPGPA